jgi:hypothetical protein
MTHVSVVLLEGRGNTAHLRVLSRPVYLGNPLVHLLDGLFHMLANHLNSVIMHLPRIRTVLVQQCAIGVPASPLMSIPSKLGRKRADAP